MAQLQDTSQWLELLYLAMTKQVGIAVTTDHVESACAKFRSLRDKSGDHDLDRLMFYASTFDPRELWIVKGPATSKTLDIDAKGLGL